MAQQMGQGHFGYLPVLVKSSTNQNFKSEILRNNTLIANHFEQTRNAIGKSMLNQSWTATKKKYRECASYVDSGRLTSNEDASLIFKTHFVRPNNLRLEWLGVPLERQEGTGKVEHRVLLLLNGTVTVADKLEDGSWMHRKAKTLFAALRDDSWRSGVGHAVIPLLLNNGAFLRKVGYSKLQVEPLASGAVVCKFEDSMYSWTVKTNLDGEIVEHNFWIFGKQTLKTQLMGGIYDAGTSTKLDTWMNSSDTFIRTLNFHSIEFDSKSIQDIFKSSEKALDPLIKPEEFS